MHQWNKQTAQRCLWKSNLQLVWRSNLSSMGCPNIGGHYLPSWLIFRSRERLRKPTWTPTRDLQKEQYVRSPGFQPVWGWQQGQPSSAGSLLKWPLTALHGNATTPQWILSDEFAVWILKTQKCKPIPPCLKVREFELILLSQVVHDKLHSLT